NFLDALKRAVTVAVNSDEDFVCICTDNCLLEDGLDYEQLITYIRSAASFGAKILMGNIGSYDEGLYCGSNLFWINAFENTSFFVIFKTFYKTIISLEINKQTSIWNIINEATS